MIDFVLHEHRHAAGEGGGGGGVGAGVASGGATSAAPLEVITPRDPSQRGCQLSMLVRKDAKAFNERLKAAGVICDFREPNIIRAAPVPLYNSFHDVWRFAMILRDHLRTP
jgi:kynureninase